MNVLITVILYISMINYISIKQILDDLLDNEMLQGLTLERAVNYAVRFIQIVGLPNMFEDRIAVIKIEDYRGQLPCDLYEVIGVKLHNEDLEFRYTTDIYDTKNQGYTYKINNSVIHTSVDKCLIDVSYRAMMLDRDGYPLIPDNSSFIEALELYIKKQRYMNLVEQGKMNLNIYNLVSQEYAFKVGQAKEELRTPTLDQMQNISNLLNRMIVPDLQEQFGFRNIGEKHHWRRH